MKENFKWKCPKCGRKVNWNGKGDKPDTTCKGGLIRKHNKVQMPLIKMPKK
jgi:hypothetical protein